MQRFSVFVPHITHRETRLHFQVVFEGMRGHSYRGDVAIDDVTVQNGPCPIAGSCDFEKGMCAFMNEVKDDKFDWIRNTGHTASIGTGPSVDHTLNSAQGLDPGFFELSTTVFLVIFSGEVCVKSFTFEPQNHNMQCTQRPLSQKYFEE